MDWPQYVMLVSYGLAIILNLVSQARDTSKTSTQVTVHVMGYAATVAVYAWVLHCGGFW